MKNERLLNTLGQVDEKFIVASAPENIKKSNRIKINVWIKWSAMAACFCLMAGILVPIATNLFNVKGSYGSQDNFLSEITLLYFQGALYECCDVKEGLQRVGLPSEITEDMAGEHVAYIELGGIGDYQETIEVTDKELYQYAPAPTKAVYVLRDGENYMAAVFCRTFFPGDIDAYTDLAEVYRFFDISDASDIVSIAQTDWHRGKVTGVEITDENIIEEFHTLTTDITKFISLGNDEFQSIVFDGIPEEDQQEAHNAFADDLQVIRVETKDGFKFYLSYYPNYGFLYSGHAMAYHQVTPELKVWFESNMGIN